MSPERQENPPGASARPPNAPGYQPLRMAAEWASAVRGEPLNFAYDTATGQMMLAPPGSAGVSVLTSAGVPRALVASVELEWARPHGGPPGAVYELSGADASALFWGESAVEKFLLSYYASAAADAAPRFLARLFDAWYGYPAKVVQVCALAYRCGRRAPPHGRALTLARTVGLLCLDETGVRLLSLDEFEARYATGLPRGGCPAPATGPSTSEAGWTIDAAVESIVLRDAAEFVSGLRGRFVRFQAVDGTLLPDVYPSESPLPAPDPPPAGAFVFAGVAEPVRPDRPFPVRVTVRVKGLDGSTSECDVVPRGSDPAVVPDSMFWSDGAVEKLLLPYYASVKGGTAWFFLAWLMGKWDGSIPHDANDPELVVQFARHRLGMDEVEDVPTVYAVTHLPRSEYEDSSSALEGRTVLLALGRTGHHVAHPLLADQGRGGDE